MKVQRFSWDRDARPFFREYLVNVKKGTTVVDALFEIKEKMDPTLTWRVSCRMGICGSCGMLINGFPMLACQTQILELETERLVLQPLPNYPVIKDLVSDFSELYEKQRLVKPYIVRKDLEELERPTREYVQTPEQMERYLQFSYCIMCGLCNSACPVTPTDRKFTGPQALAQAYRYVADSRDEGAELRFAAVDNSHGCWRCHFAGTCSLVCPRGVDPALAIQLLRRETLRDKVGMKGGKLVAQVAAPGQFKPREGVPRAPPPSVRS